MARRQASFKAIHYFEYLYQRLRDLAGEIKPLNINVAYQRPCSSRLFPDKHRYVAKIMNLIAANLVEREYQDENAFCCGGGGGNFFTDIMGGGEESPARIRIGQALDTGAEILAVSCPQCAKMLDDALNAQNLGGKMKVLDVSEIAALAVL